MSEHLPSFIVSSITNKFDDIYVAVDYRLKPGTITVSPDVFARMSKLAEEDNREELFRQAMKDAREIK